MGIRASTQSLEHDANKRKSEVNMQLLVTEPIDMTGNS